MPYTIDETHDPGLTSWVESAAVPGTDFPIQNLPFGVFQGGPPGARPRVGVAIGDQILDLSACQLGGFLGSSRAGLACLESSLNPLMGLGPADWSALRRRVSDLLRADGATFAREPERLRACLVPMGEAELLVPALIGDYTDFYASIYHAVNLGSILRPDNPLLPNYKYVPVAYHGRSSTVVVSGTPVRRPHGQSREAASGPPLFGPCRELDYELEVGFFVGRGNEMGAPVPVSEAWTRIFGMCLVNDWSARDIQRWEYQPLGPFLGKSFATTISPWVVTLHALEPFRVPAFPRPAEDPAPLPHLACSVDAQRGGFDVELEVWLSSRSMREQGIDPVAMGRSNVRHLYWTPAQMIAHHTSNGCRLRPGDLLASGTLSGPGRDARGSLIELTWRGREPVTLSVDEERRFLEDGDEVLFRGRCRRDGFAPIGFGECRGLVEPA